MSKKIAIAEFRAKNIKENPMTTTYVEYSNGLYHYLAQNGYRTTKYRSLEEAKDDIGSLWGKWYDFKFLV